MRVKTPLAAKCAGGSALIAALFLLTIAAAIGAVMMQKLQYQNAARNMPVSATRARFAAATGIEWASYRVARSGGCVAGVLALSENALRGFSVTLTCSRTLHGGGTRSVYVLTALAQYGRYGQSDYAAYRQVSNLLI
jgi:hypothetical protein